MKANKTGNNFQYLYFNQVPDDPCRTKLPHIAARF
jgi:hypothetical protein